MFQIRHLEEDDHKAIISVMKDWWGGRDLSGLLPRLFFQHFKLTSFVLEDQGRIIGFLVGFLSQTYPGEAYIHFAGIDPEYQRQGLGRILYDHFFEIVKGFGRTTVRAITSPVNKTSIAFHTGLGFTIEDKGQGQDGVPVYPDHDGRDGARVLFKKELS
jgi:ribosomal protein S18 acetylase RimI-like enzyme